MAKGPGTLVDAGFINTDGKITPKAKSEFIRQVKKEMKEGSSSALFPTGVSIDPNPSFDLPLEDEKTFSAFHKNSFKNYENIAGPLNLKGNFSLLPAIADPIAVVSFLKPDLKLNIDFMKLEFIPYLTPPLIPQLVTLLKLQPPEIPKLTADLTNLVKIPPIPEIPTPPSLELPDPLVFPELYSVLLPALKIPGVFPDLIPKIPSLALKIASLDLPNIFADISLLLIQKAFALPKIPDFGPSAIAMKIAVANVTVRMTAVMMLASVVGVTLGSSPAGIVGGIGSFWGVK